MLAGATRAEIREFREPALSPAGSRPTVAAPSTQSRVGDANERKEAMPDDVPNDRHVEHNDEPWLSRNQIAKYLGCSTRSVSRLERDSLLRIRIGERTRYRKSDVEAWMRERAS